MLFKQHTKEEQASSLSHFLPNGRVFAKKFTYGSNLFQFVMGLACELYRVEEKMNMIAFEHDINETTQFINEWESAVGIPNDCLTSSGTLEERRTAILVMLSKMNVTTVQDFIDLADEFGVTVTIAAGADVGLFPLPFPFIFFSTPKEARFTMVIDFPTTLEVFPLTFPIPFGDGIIGVIKCLFNHVKPANVQIIYTS